MTVEMHGPEAHTDRTVATWTHAKAMEPAGASWVCRGTAPDSVAGWELPAGVTSGAYFLERVPAGVVTNAVPTVTVRFAPQSALGGVVKLLATVLPAAMGTVLSSAGTGATGSPSAGTSADELRFGTCSPGVSVSAGNYYRVCVQREGGDAGDTHEGPVTLLGVQVNYLGDQ